MLFYIPKIPKIMISIPVLQLSVPDTFILSVLTGTFKDWQHTLISITSAIKVTRIICVMTETFFILIFCTFFGQRVHNW